MSRGPFDLARLRILVAVNHGLMRRLLHEMLRGFGVTRIVEAKGWALAMDRAYRESLDAAIVDFVLDEGDGADFAWALRRDPACRNRDVPILLMAAAPGPDTVAKALTAGIDGMLVKPFAPRDLRARLHAMLTAPRRFVVTADYAGPMRPRHGRAVAALHQTPRPPPRPGAGRPTARRTPRRIVGLVEALFLKA